MINIVERIGDMGEGLKLSLFRQEDGDIILSILPEDHIITEHSIEFCTSGTKSHNTMIALSTLFRAMVKDNKEAPQGKPKKCLGEPNGG